MNNTREIILNEAFKLFLQKSYKEVSIQDIAGKVGMTKGAFYYFFKSKEEIFREVFNNLFLYRMEIDYNKFSGDSLYEFYNDIQSYSDNIGLVFNQNGVDVKTDSSINIFAFIFDSLKHFSDLRIKVKKVQLSELNAWEEIICSARTKGEIKSTLSDEQIAKIFIYTSDGIILDSVIQDKSMNSSILWEAFYATLKA